MSKKFDTPKSTSFASVLSSVAPKSHTNGSTAIVAPSLNGSASVMGTMVPLALIRLDPNQPRKQIPPKILDAIKKGDSLTQVVQTWAKANNIPVSVVTDSEEKLIDPGLQAVRRRAGSIYRHGLVQPVTLIDTGTGTYTVQVGETRVLAHAWLAACGESKFEEIEAKITQRSSKDYTRKYVENVEREDLSGIEKMISVCQVLFELSGQNVPDFNDPKTLIRMKQIRDDGPTKHGLVEWRAVESDLNLHTQLRYYLTQLLDLPFEALAIALAHRVAEGTLRTLMNQTKANEELRLQVLKVVANRAATEGPSVWTSSNMTATIAALQNSPGSSATPAKFDAAKSSIRGLKAAHRALSGLEGKELEATILYLAGDAETVALCQHLKKVIDGVVASSKKKRK